MSVSFQEAKTHASIAAGNVALQRIAKTLDYVVEPLERAAQVLEWWALADMAARDRLGPHGHEQLKRLAGSLWPDSSAGRAD
jgi:hypothetical protein